MNSRYGGLRKKADFCMLKIPNAGPDNVVEMMNAEIDRLIKQYKK